MLSERWCPERDIDAPTQQPRCVKSWTAASSMWHWMHWVLCTRGIGCCHKRCTHLKATWLCSKRTMGGSQAVCRWMCTPRFSNEHDEQLWLGHGKVWDMNPVSLVWSELSMNALLASKLSEYHKLAEIVVVHVMGSCAFHSYKSTLRNQLIDHLALTSMIFAQPVFCIDTFPYGWRILHIEKHQGSVCSPGLVWWRVVSGTRIHWITWANGDFDCQKFDLSNTWV